MVNVGWIRMVTGTIAVSINWLPLPVSVTFELPSAASEAAVRAIVCGTSATKEMAEGLALTPWGNPVIATLTAALKPLIAEAETENWAEPPS